jgi:predicted nucleic acid-binding protein
MEILMPKNEKGKLVLFDADVVIAFAKGGLALYLPSIYPDRGILLNIVKDELVKWSITETIVNNITNNTTPRLKLVSLQEDKIEIIKEYATLTGLYGQGESACMAYAKFNDCIVASNNLRDIRKYCEENNIEFYTTIDVLYEGYKLKLYTEEQCDDFLRIMNEKKEKVPYKNLQQYINEKKEKK